MTLAPSAAPPAARPAGLDGSLVKADFPLLSNRPGLVFLDSAASSQKPRVVIEAMSRYYENTHANVHRGVYALAEEATAAYEQARARVARFVNAYSAEEVVFTKNATEAFNLIAHSYARSVLEPGDAVLLSEMEHHANLIPWFILAKERGIELRFLATDDDGYIVTSDLEAKLDGVKLVGLTLASNVLGTITPFRQVADASHEAGAVVVADGAQFVPHLATDVRELGCDFLAFSAHKMCGPTGIGALWARGSILETMPPFLGGGEMVQNVTLEGFTPTEAPWRFEAGTPPVAEAVGFAAGIDYLEGLGMASVRAHEIALTTYALSRLASLGDGLVLYGPQDPADRVGALSFTYDGIHPHDLSQVLDDHGVCVRAGHHCAKPLMCRLGVSATARASLYIYNDESDVDALVGALGDAHRLFNGAS